MTPPGGAGEPRTSQAVCGGQGRQIAGTSQLALGPGLAINNLGSLAVPAHVAAAAARPFARHARFLQRRVTATSQRRQRRHLGVCVGSVRRHSLQPSAITRASMGWDTTREVQGGAAIVVVGQQRLMRRHIGVWSWAAASAGAGTCFTGTMFGWCRKLHRLAANRQSNGGCRRHHHGRDDRHVVARGGGWLRKNRAALAECANAALPCRLRAGSAGAAPPHSHRGGSSRTLLGTVG